MNMSKSRDIQAKMPSPKVIFYAFWLVTVKVLNSYEKYRKNGKEGCRGAAAFFSENHENCSSEKAGESIGYIG